MKIKYNSKELDLMARLMRAEALGEGEMGMLLVGNVIVNRVIAYCNIFENAKSIYEVIYQSPGGFSGINTPLFQSSPTSLEKRLAKRCIQGETFFPATHALWFYAPKNNSSCKSSFYSQPLAGKYKSHCFYVPQEGTCPELY